MIVKRILAQNGYKNFSYVLKSRTGKVVVIDPICNADMFDAISEFGNKVDIIINTHSHADHTAGNSEMVKKFDSTVMAHDLAIDGVFGHTKQSLKDGDEIELDNANKLLVVHTPGHTKDSICLLHIDNDKAVTLFTADTLFNAGVGNVHNGGDVQQLYNSIIRLKEMVSDDVIICPGHDYMDTNLNFAKSIDKNEEVYDKLIGNAELCDFGIEAKVNLFLRVKEDHVQKLMDSDDPEEAFIKLRALRDNW